MQLFTIALAVLFVLVMVYVWQHFSSIEYGYRIQESKAATGVADGNEPRTAPGRSVAERSGTY